MHFNKIDETIGENSFLHIKIKQKCKILQP